MVSRGEEGMDPGDSRMQEAEPDHHWVWGGENDEDIRLVWLGR